jgi:O-succinylbenzoate synthase
MKVVAVSSRRVRWPLPPHGAARGGDWREREAIIVAVRTDDGSTGLGEAAPLPGMSRDTLDDAEHAIRDLAARSPFAVAPSLAREVTDAPAAVFAIETALALTFAQRAGTSVAGVFAEHAPRAATSEHAMRATTVVDDESDARAATTPCLKIKVGAAPFADDLARAKRIARAAPEAALRVDANRRWPRGEAIARLAALRDALGDALEYVEEPCEHAHELLASALPVPIALDESLVAITDDDLAAALRAPGLAALVLKPTLLGGFVRCLELAAAARAHGKWPVVTHALEGAVGRAAVGELARVVGGPP